MQQRGEKNSGQMRSVAAFVGRLAFAVVVLLTSPARSFATELLKSPSPFDNFGKFDESKAEKWKELESPLPAWPEEAHLIPARMPVTYTLKVYVDEKSITRLADGIARFTLVVESPSGARNVFFEGYNCEKQEYKTYATGAADRTFVPMKKPKWERVPYYEINAFRFQLSRHYVCDPNALSSALRPQDFVRRLKDATSE